jgi:hypothetical protein
MQTTITHMAQYDQLDVPRACIGCSVLGLVSVIGRDGAAGP